MPEEKDDNTTEVVARAPVKRVTEREVQAIMEVWDTPECKRSAMAAARLTGINYQRVWKIVKSNKFLRASHPSSDAEEGVPKRDEPEPDRESLIKKAELDRIEAMAHQQLMLVKGDYAELGLSESGAEHAANLEQIAMLPLARLARLSHGGLVSTLIGNSQVYDKYLKLLMEKELPQEFDNEGNPIPYEKTERQWVNSLVGLSGAIRQIHGSVNDSTLLLAKLKDINDKKTTKGKPGFNAIELADKDG